MTVSSPTVAFASAGQNWNDLMDAAVRMRRHLHQNPELTWKETETAAIIRQSLDALGISWRTCADTGTVAMLASNAKGPHIALRGDMDALPIVETTKNDWSSTREGCMHACGHDGHTATLFAAASWLKQHEDQLPGPVTLLFQPAEEGGHGAKRMIEDGALKGVETIFGWHNWPAIPFGKAVCPDGPVMAGNGTFRITMTGAGGHASQPELCCDPVLAAAAVTLALQQVVSRRLTPQHAAVLSVTSIDAPSTPTVIPDKAVLEGSIRIAQSSDREVMNRLIEQIACDTAASYGVEGHVEIFPRYDATINHAEPAHSFRGALAQELGDDWHAADVAVPIMASEDFSYYLKEIPGAFALIGSDDGDGHDVPCHNARYDFNDRLIPMVTKLYARLAGAPLPTTSS